MTSKKVKNNTPHPLQKKVDELQRELNEIRGSQVTFFSEVQSQLQSIRSRENRQASILKLVKRLVMKVKEHEVRMHTMMTVLGGKFKNRQCECGKVFCLIDLNQQDEKDDQIKSDDMKQMEKKKKKNSKRKSRHENEEVTQDFGAQLPKGDCDYMPSRIQTFEEQYLGSRSGSIQTIEESTSGSEEEDENISIDESVSVTSSKISSGEEFRWNFRILKSHKQFAKTNWLRIFHGNDKAFIQSEWFSLKSLSNEIPLLGTLRFHGLNDEFYEVEMAIYAEKVYMPDFKFPFDLYVRVKILRGKNKPWHTDYHHFVFKSFSNFFSAEPNKLLIKISPKDRKFPPNYTVIFRKE